MTASTRGQLDEPTLLARARDGDIGSFEILVRRHVKRVHAAHQRLGAAATDATEAAFLAAWHRLPRLDRGTSFAALLGVHGRPAHERVGDPPPDLVDRITAAARAQQHPPAAAIPLPSARGGLDITPPALATVLRYAVDGVGELFAQRCRVERVGDEYAVRVWMSVSLRRGFDPVDALADARLRVRAALAEWIGLRLAGLEIELADLWGEGDGRA